MDGRKTAADESARARRSLENKDLWISDVRSTLARLAGGYLGIGNRQQAVCNTEGHRQCQCVPMQVQCGRSATCGEDTVLKERRETAERNDCLKA